MSRFFLLPSVFFGIAALAVLLFCPPKAFAVDISLEWNPNGESDLAGYRIFVRAAGESYNYGRRTGKGLQQPVGSMVSKTIPTTSLSPGPSTLPTMRVVILLRSPTWPRRMCRRLPTPGLIGQLVRAQRSRSMDRIPRMTTGVSSPMRGHRPLGLL